MTDLMVEAALRGLALALLVGLGLSALRVRNVPARKAAWTLVLLASLAMPFLMRWPDAAGLPQRFAWIVPLRTSGTAAPPAMARETPATAAPAWEDEGLAASTRAMPAQRKAERTAPLVSEKPEDKPELPAVALSAAPIADTLVPPATPAGSMVRHWPPVGRMIVWMYLAVSGALLLRLLVGVGAALRLWAAAERVSPLIATEPFVRSSDRITSPVTIGSGIVLPADYRQWDRQKLRMVLAHEQSHVRQMDFYLQLLAGLYTAAFWFSPLGWWLRRTLASLGEAIGDRAGMDAARSRSGYAQVVLEFAAAPRRALPGVAMACSGNLSKRVESMLNENLFRRAFAEGRRRAIASLIVIPAALFAATALVRVPAAAAQAAPATQPAQANPAANTQPSQAQTPATGQSKPPEDQVTTADPSDVQNPPAPAAAPQPAGAPQAAPAAPAPSSDLAPAVAPAIPPEPPADLAPLVAPFPPQSPLVMLPPSPDGHGSMAILGDGDSVRVHGPHHFLINDGTAVNGFGFQFTENGDSYAVVEGPGTQFTFSGNWPGDFAAEIDRARKQANGPFLWFHHDGKSYIVTDPAILAQVEATYKPMDDLGIRQKLVGQTQKNLGTKREELAREAKEARDLSDADGARVMAEIQAESKEAESEWNARTKAEVDAELKAAQAELGPEKMAQLQAEMQTMQKEMTPEKMAEVQANVQAAMKQLNSADMAVVQAKLKALEDRWNLQSTAELQAQMADMQAKLNAMRAKLAARQADFGSEFVRLGDEQGRLGEEMGRLGEQQGKLAFDMGRAMQKIIQQTLDSGKAQPLR